MFFKFIKKSVIFSMCNIHNIDTQYSSRYQNSRHHNLRFFHFLKNIFLSLSYLKSNLYKETEKILRSLISISSSSNRNYYFFPKKDNIKAPGPVCVPITGPISQTSAILMPFPFNFSINASAFSKSLE